MPDVSIAISAKDNFSQAMRKMASSVSPLRKDDLLQGNLDKLNRTKTTLFGDQTVAQDYLEQTKTMANTTPFLCDDLAVGAVNPQFTNLTTGEFVRVNWTIPADTVLEINTAYGAKSVTLIDTDGVRTNAFAHLDLDSTFWYLAVGENELTYSADGDTRTTEAEIIYNLRRLGV